MLELARTTMWLGALGLASLATAGEMTLRRDQLIPIRFSDSVNLRDARPGDRVRAEVEAGNRYPRGLVLVGEIRNIRAPRGNQPGRVDLAFTSVVLPDGARQPFTASPLARGARDTREAGRIYTRTQGRRKENTVLGGALGGLLVGSALRKPAEGLILGTVGSIFAAEADRGPNLEEVVRRGDRYNAIVDADVQLRWNEFRDREAGRDRDWDREDRPTSRDPQARNPSVGPDGPVSVERDGARLRFPENLPAISEEGVVMVPMEATASLLGLKASRSDKFWYLEDEENLVRLDPTSREARINGKKVALERIPAERNGALYVPLQVFSAITSARITVSGNL